MKINNIGYLLKEGIKGVFLHGFMSFAAVCVTVACLLIIGSFSSLMYNLSLMVEDLNQTNEILVYVDSELSEAEAKSIGTRINQIDNVYEAKFVSRKEALENFIADHEGDEALSGIDETYLRHRFEVILEDNTLMEKTVSQVENITGVVKISSTPELATGFSTLEQVLQIVSVGVIGVLLVVSLLIISNTVKLAMYDRRDEISIMKMVGATNGFIRLPFMVEGFCLGMLGAALAFFAEWGLYDLLVTKIEEADYMKLFNFVPFEELLQPMIITFCAAGLFVSIVGSWTSIRKFMDV